ncbi:MAG: Asd/ArgC dimerization domain-containing protein [Bryobacteraceae bacterium]
MHLHRGTSKPVIAVVGGESLLGKEVRELLDTGHLPASVKLIAAAEGADAILTRGHDEPAVMSSLQAADLGTARVAILTGSAESSRKAYEQIRGATPAPVVIDVNGGLEDQPETRLRAPMVEPDGHSVAGAIHAIAHPAAIALALFLIHLRKAGATRRSIAQIFEPASERGQVGLEELQKQTVGLLSFKPLAKDVYDAQLSFNMLPQFGADSPHSLAEIESKIDRHLASLLAVAGSGPMPSLRLIQAPVFHGYSISVWVEFESNPGMEAILRALESEQIDVRGADHEPPTNAGIAGQGGISVGGIAADRNEPRACWFWVVADNLRIVAENAVEVARELL